MCVLKHRILVYSYPGSCGIGLIVTSQPVNAIFFGCGVQNMLDETVKGSLASFFPPPAVYCNDTIEGFLPGQDPHSFSQR
jgi:hypothetical protein